MTDVRRGEPCSDAKRQPLRVLIATAWLGDRRGGTELYALEVATELLRRGHQPAIFSPALGAMADEARAAGIQVVDNLAEIAEAPDVIHGQHHVETATALLHFPGTPAVSFCLSSRFWSEIPLRHPRVRRYVACDRPTYERITLEYGMDSSCVDTILNFVDLRKFRQRGPLPPRPGRALVFSNYATERSHVPAVRAACEQRGITLDVVGAQSGQQSRQPEALLVHYDLVFAKARAAIEAMAVGAAVIVCDFDGVGPLVSTANVDELRALNFGYRVQTEPHRPDTVLEQIDRYDADDARAVSDHIRAVSGLDQAIDAIELNYRQAITECPAVPWAVEMRAAAEYVNWLNPYLREREQTLGWAERLLEIAEERSELIEALTVECARWTASAESLRETAEERSRLIEELTAECARWTASAESLRETAEERSRLIEELTAECDRRASWAQGLLKTAEERGRLVDELTTELERRTAWAEGLLAEADRRGEVIEQLERTVAERTAWAEGLLETAEARGALLVDLQRELDEQRARS